jgi:arylsulfatase A-like enzyme
MQAPEVFDIGTEPESVRRLYGLDQPRTEPFGKQCLIARRLVERGVRFVQLHTESNWDHHTGIRTELPACCAGLDQPVAGLLKDLKARGLFDETLVIWGGEFGRSPVAQKGDGRDHHPYGFTMWLAGGGVQGGMVHGATDEFGWYAVEDKVHVHDLHATVLHLMGIDHERLTYRYAGRDYRLTDVSGNIIKKIIA